MSDHAPTLYWSTFILVLEFVQNMTHVVTVDVSGDSSKHRSGNIHVESILIVGRWRAKSDFLKLVKLLLMSYAQHLVCCSGPVY